MRRGKKTRGPRPRLTHFEVRRGDTLRLRLAIADDAVADVGDELGALLRKIAPSAVSHGVVDIASPSEIIIAPQHADDDDAYHAGLHDRLAELFGALCDSALADALEIAREESARRSDGGN